MSIQYDYLYAHAFYVCGLIFKRFLNKHIYSHFLHYFCLLYTFLFSLLVWLHPCPVLVCPFVKVIVLFSINISFFIAFLCLFSKRGCLFRFHDFNFLQLASCYSRKDSEKKRILGLTFYLHYKTLNYKTIKANADRLLTMTLFFAYSYTVVFHYLWDEHSSMWQRYCSNWVFPI